jgi:adenine phosphoribosyltransferase
MTEALNQLIRDVPDFPKPGIVFKDITPLLKSPGALQSACEQLAAPFRDARINQVAGIESRGFIFGSIVAQILGAGFIPIRKPGKLPWTTRRLEYELEYGSDSLEIHDDAAAAGDRVLIIDDVLATGGTLGCAARLITELGAELAGAATVIELGFLDGRKKLGDVKFHSLIVF